MSVYTSVTADQLKVFLNNYHIGDLKAFRGIAEGVENTNYRVTSTAGEYILTLFEHFTHEQIPYYLSLLTHLHKDGVPCPRAIVMENGTQLGTINNRPAVLFTFLQGKSALYPNLIELEALGRVMAQMHLSLEKFDNFNDHKQPHQTAIESLKPFLKSLHPDEARLYQNELKHQQGIPSEHLPMGLIHGDLFKDNCLIDNGDISGVLDFYSASIEAYIFDIAIAASDWCRDEENKLNKNKMNILLKGYQSTRKLEDIELALWPKMLRLAAFRFWCSRLVDQFQPRDSELNVKKDPADYKHLLLFLRDNAHFLQIQE